MKKDDKNANGGLPFAPGEVFREIRADDYFRSAEYPLFPLVDILNLQIRWFDFNGAAGRAQDEFMEKHVGHDKKAWPTKDAEDDYKKLALEKARMKDAQRRIDMALELNAAIRQGKITISQARTLDEADPVFGSNFIAVDMLVAVDVSKWLLQQRQP